MAFIAMLFTYLGRILEERRRLLEALTSATERS
jgi:hypothetical protein